MSLNYWAPALEPWGCNHWACVRTRAQQQESHYKKKPCAPHLDSSPGLPQPEKAPIEQWYRAAENNKQFKNIARDYDVFSLGSHRAWEFAFLKFPRWWWWGCLGLQSETTGLEGRKSKGWWKRKEVIVCSAGRHYWKFKVPRVLGYLLSVRDR